MYALNLEAIGYAKVSWLGRRRSRESGVGEIQLSRPRLLSVSWPSIPDCPGNNRTVDPAWTHKRLTHFESAERLSVDGPSQMHPKIATSRLSSRSLSSWLPPLECCRSRARSTYPGC